jgi:hypothetical protein
MRLKHSLLLASVLVGQLFCSHAVKNINNQILGSNKSNRPIPEYPCPGPPPTCDSIFQHYGVLKGPVAEKLGNNSDNIFKATTTREWQWNCFEQHFIVTEELLDGEPIRVTIYGEMPIDPLKHMPGNITLIEVNHNYGEQPCKVTFSESEDIQRIMNAISKDSFETSRSGIREYYYKGQVESVVEGGMESGCFNCIFFSTGTNHERAFFMGYSQNGFYKDSFYGPGTQFVNSSLIPLIMQLAERHNTPCK